ncbi:MAG: NUDIX domain-containing protein, partial [Bacteroidales bacterium]
MPSLSYCYAHPRPSITADCVILGIEKHDIKILLIERKGVPYQHCWALPGGFLNMDETIEEC